MKRKPSATSFKKGQIPWNKGISVSPKEKARLKTLNIGRKHTEKSKIERGERMKKMWQDGISPLPIFSGEKSSGWKGGISMTYKKKNVPRPKPDFCEVCGTFVGKSIQKGNRGIHYDHNHITGEFRGWLCAGCNIALGMVKDNPKTLIALAEYLTKLN